MTFFSVLLALVIEQLRALDTNNRVSALLRRHAASAAPRPEVDPLDASATVIDADSTMRSRTPPGVVAWLGVVLPWTLAVGVVYYLLFRINIVLAFAWNVAVLYFTLGFRQFSHYFSDIHLALNNDDVPLARDLLKQWTGIETTDMPVSEIVRHTLMYAVISSHRHVFGVFFWFLIPIGPAGAVFYRVAAHLSATWTAPIIEGRPASGGFAKRAFFVIDWIPSRLTALGFAIVGNFEDAIYAWRNHAGQWPDSNEGTLLAAGSGALGARLVGPLAEPSSTETLQGIDLPSQAVPVGEECSPRTLQSAVGLVWRAVILWMIVLLLVTVSTWLG